MTHYFHTPTGSTPTRELDVELAGRALTVSTAGGVFSGDRLDLGTRVLLREVPDPPGDGDLLDLGCGWGPIALTLALRAPAATVWAVDVNDLALDLTRRNARRAGVTVRAARPDDVPAGLRFAAIWSNPPIRIGKAALRELLRRWLPRLAPGGAAHLVVQRNLGADSLQSWLVEEGFPAERSGSAKGYRVLTVRGRSGIERK